MELNISLQHNVLLGNLWSCGCYFGMYHQPKHCCRPTPPKRLRDTTKGPWCWPSHQIPQILMQLSICRMHQNKGNPWRPNPTIHGTGRIHCQCFGARHHGLPPEVPVGSEPLQRHKRGHKIKQVVLMWLISVCNNTSFCEKHCYFFMGHNNTTLE